MEFPFPVDILPPFKKPISPMKEMVAYEALWQNKAANFKQLPTLFATQPGKLPSDLVADEQIESLYPTIKDIVLNSSMGYRTNLLIHGSFDYPKRLRQAAEPIELLYYSGNLDLLSTRSISMVGTRHPTEDGLQQAAQLSRFLVKHNFTIISGLATGIDTISHKTAIAENGRTIAVIGTPLDQSYPEQNKDLQKQIARDHLLVTQVPFIRYREQSIKGNRLFFPERNKTMSALSEATVIVEAGETSGTLIQARAALFQKRKLFILENCFQNKNITWPARYWKLGAIRVKNYEDILLNLPSPDQP
ncbi:MAG: DNA-processing protein DprA [Chitinophagaceae bacterium]